MRPLHFLSFAGGSLIGHALASLIVGGAFPIGILMAGIGLFGYALTRIGKSD
jgi:hypothetical protein